jgi:two-component system chemotaxis sensor kinase CheA
LTLAIVQALIVMVGSERYAVPLAHIVETGHVEEIPARTTGGTISHRGATLPAVVLRGVTGAPGSGRSGRRAPVVVVDQGHRRIGVVVDTLVGRQHIVVEPVDAPRGMPRWINGAAILGDGVPILVLDPMVLV